MPPTVSRLGVLKRCWQLYAAHILLFVFFIAQITWVAIRFDNAAFIDELNIAEFHDNPQDSIIGALILRYRPVNLDVLPLCIVLLAGLPLCLWLLTRSRILTLVLSVALWLGVQRYDWAFPIYEAGDTWLFNPLGWQLIFVIGALWLRPSALLASALMISAALAMIFPAPGSQPRQLRIVNPHLPTRWRTAPPTVAARYHRTWLRPTSRCPGSRAR